MRTICSPLLAAVFVFATMMPILPAAADDHGSHDGPGVGSGNHDDDDGGPGHDDGDDDHHDGGDGSGDVTCDSARCAILAEVQTSCPCDTSSRLKYLACVLRVTNRLADRHKIPQRCRGRVIGCALESTCGRPSAVACQEPRYGICDVRHSRCVGSPARFCSTFRDCPLPPKCDIESSARHCQAEGGLVLPQTSCCGDCEGGTTTTTSSTVPSTSVSSTSVSSTSVSSTSTTSSTTTSTTVAACGNGVVDAGEQCDPPGSATCPSGSPGGALLCQADCTCPPTTSTSSSTSTSTSTSSSTSEPTPTSSTSTSTSTSTSSSTSVGSVSGAFVAARPGRWPIRGHR